MIFSPVSRTDKQFRLKLRKLLNRLLLKQIIKYNICSGRGKKGSAKYEQIMNRHENEEKTAEFRIFRQIPAKMRLGSQCLCGFPEGTVEMKVARLGH